MKKLFLAILIFALFSCAGPKRGPDKQFAGTIRGAAIGAGAGAVTGSQVAAATGPGVAVGAGFGAIYGAIQGAIQDANEMNLMRMSAMTRNERERAVAHEILHDHYEKRLALHPSRDIFPADLFFFGDETKPKPITPALVRELAYLNKSRYPWSRLAIVVYVQSRDHKDNEYARLLAQDRSAKLGDLFVAYGIHPRRIETRAVITSAPVLIDPNDHPARYSHAIELVPLDK